MKKYVVFGGFGQLGLALQKEKPEDVLLYPVSRQRISITDYDTVKKYLEFIQPDVVVNAAAYTNVNKAEDEFLEAFNANTQGPAILAELCEEMGIRFIHISTDYVFNGSNSVTADREGYVPYNQTSPLNAYGKTKEIGERWVTGINNQALVIRTSGVYSEFGNNFAKTIYNAAKEGRKEFDVVADQVCCPTYAPDLARVIYEYGHGDAEHILGITHFAGDESISWFNFAKLLTSEFDSVIVSPTETSPQAKPERPKNSSLKTTGFTPSDFREGVAKTLKAINKV